MSVTTVVVGTCWNVLIIRWFRSVKLRCPTAVAFPRGSYVCVCRPTFEISTITYTYSRGRRLRGCSGTRRNRLHDRSASIE